MAYLVPLTPTVSSRRAMTADDFRSMLDNQNDDDVDVTGLDGDTMTATGQASAAVVLGTDLCHGKTPFPG